MTVHIYSTLANSNEYIRFSEHGPQGVNIPERSVLIKGGAGINQKYLQTPLGVHTTVSDEEYEWLKDEFSFKQHVQNGYIKVRKSEVHPEVAAADMVTHDRKSDACPLVPQDFNEDDKKETIRPVVNKKSKAA